MTNPIAQQLYVATSQVHKGFEVLPMFLKELSGNVPELAEVAKCYENVNAELQKAEDILKGML
jgi:hypothetical protein